MSVEKEFWASFEEEKKQLEQLAERAGFGCQRGVSGLVTIRASK